MGNWSWKLKGSHLDGISFPAPSMSTAVEIRLPRITKSGNLWELVYRIDRKRKLYVYYRRQLVQKGYMHG